MATVYRRPDRELKIKQTRYIIFTLILVFVIVFLFKLIFSWTL